MTLSLALGLSGCFTAEDPGTFKCSKDELDCPDGYECDKFKWECIEKGSKPDGKVDGPVVDMGQDMAADMGQDMAAEMGNDMAADADTGTILPKPVAHWKFDEGSGTKVSDSSGNKHDGNVNKATWIKGVSGKGLSFAGAGHVATPFIPQYGPKDSFSLVAWFKTTNSTKSSSIFGLEKSKTSEIQLGLDTSGIVRFNLNDGSAGGDAKSTKTFADNVWHMMAAVRDGTGKKLYIYVDGVQVAFATDKSTGSINSTTKLPLSIGAVNQGSKHEKYFNGSIDEPQIFNSALTAGEIKLLYNKTP